ncbi:MAG: DUF423 domain-containing protein [Lacibacter sp.]
MADKFLKTTFLLGALAVALGAFGAHALKPLLDEAALKTYQTATHYHSLHVVALAIAGILMKLYPSKWFVRAGWLFIAGIIFFAGSLYTLTFLKAAGFENVNWLGAITPLGGLSFISGWICLFMGVHQWQRS